MFRDYNVFSTDASCFNFDDASILIEGDYLNSNTYDIFSNGTLVSSSTANGNSILFDNLFAGNYQISSNQSYNCSNNVSYITLNQPHEVIADFTFNSDTLIVGQLPAQLQLTNLSSGFTDLEWDFDDGNFSSEIHPVYLYDVSGNYDVKLNVQNSELPNCEDNKIQSIVVLDSSTVSSVETSFDFFNHIKVYRSNDNIVLRTNIDFNGTISIFNALGQLIYNEDVDLLNGDTKNFQFQLTNQLYYFVLNDGSNVNSFKVFL